MKKVFNNPWLLAIAIFLVFTLSTSANAQAKDLNPSVPVEMKFIGRYENQPVFRLDFFGKSIDKNFRITIRNEENNISYSENYSGEMFSIKFLLEIDVLGTGPFWFEVKSLTTNQKAVFQINRSVNHLEYYAVKPL